jgi:hypothetical protein
MIPMDRRTALASAAAVALIGFTGTVAAASTLGLHLFGFGSPTVSAAPAVSAAAEVPTTSSEAAPAVTDASSPVTATPAAPVTVTEIVMVNDVIRIVHVVPSQPLDASIDPTTTTTATPVTVASPTAIGDHSTTSNRSDDDSSTESTTPRSRTTHTSTGHPIENETEHSANAEHSLDGPALKEGLGSGRSQNGRNGSEHGDSED